MWPTAANPLVRIFSKLPKLKLEVFFVVTIIWFAGILADVGTTTGLAVLPISCRGSLTIISSFLLLITECFAPAIFFSNSDRTTGDAKYKNQFKNRFFVSIKIN
jgi:hypothetical protein